MKISVSIHTQFEMLPIFVSLCLCAWIRLSLALSSTVSEAQARLGQWLFGLTLISLLAFVALELRLVGFDLRSWKTRLDSITSYAVKNRKALFLSLFLAFSIQGIMSAVGIKNDLRVITDEVVIALTADFTWKHQQVGYIVESLPEAGKLKIISTFLDKRPPLFALLAGVGIELGKIHPERAGPLLNRVLLFLLLFGMGVWSASLTSSPWGALGALFLLHPAVLLSSASGGMELLFTLLIFAFSWQLSRKTLSLSRVGTLALLLGLCRYEGLAIGLLGIGIALFRMKRVLPPPQFFAFLPGFWILGEFAFYLRNPIFHEAIAQGNPVFSLSYALDHSAKLLTQGVGPHGAGFMAFAGVGLAGWTFRKERAPLFLKILGVLTLAHLCVVLPHFFSDPTHPFALRLYLVVLSFLGALSLGVFTLRRTLIASLLALAFAAYGLQIAGRENQLLRVGGAYEFEFAKKALKSSPPPSLLCVSDRPLYCTLYGFGSVEADTLDLLHPKPPLLWFWDLGRGLPKNTPSPPPPVLFQAQVPGLQFQVLQYDSPNQGVPGQR